MSPPFLFILLIIFLLCHFPIFNIFSFYIIYKRSSLWSLINSFCCVVSYRSYWSIFYFNLFIFWFSLFLIFIIITIMSFCIILLYSFIFLEILFLICFYINTIQNNNNKELSNYQIIKLLIIYLLYTAKKVDINIVIPCWYPIDILLIFWVLLGYQLFISQVCFRYQHIELPDLNKLTFYVLACLYSTSQPFVILYINMFIFQMSTIHISNVNYLFFKCQLFIFHISSGYHYYNFLVINWISILYFF